jgi:hypothetical protein
MSTFYLIEKKETKKLEYFISKTAAHRNRPTAVHFVDVI